MSNPFIFGKPVKGGDFANRRKEINKLITNAENNISTMLISPRRWGKSSLVRQASVELSSKKGFAVANMDMFQTRSENEFYSVFAKEIVQATGNKIEEWSKTVSDFLSMFRPKISFQGGPVPEWSLSFDVEDTRNFGQDILNLPQVLAEKKKLNLTICIDEFQNLSHFPEQLAFQKRCRSFWQNQKNVSYVLYGSKRHMLRDLFTKRSMPFYKFGDIIFLEKINLTELEEFVQMKFETTGKSISRELANKIVSVMECNPYYVQQFAYYVWQNTAKKANNESFDKSIEDMMNSNHYLFVKDFESLSENQIGFMRVLCDGVEKGFTRGEVIQKYNLGSSANVIKIIESLQGKEVFEKLGSKIEFIDPVFKIWLKRLFRVQVRK